MSILDGLEESIPADIVVHRKSREEGLQAIEDQLLGECVAVVSAAARFSEILPTDTEPPEDWVEQLGEKEAWKALRVAQQAWLPKKEAAYGLELCQKVASGIMTSRRKQPGEKKVLNLNLVGMTPPNMAYRTVDEKADGDS